MSTATIRTNGNTTKIGKLATFRLSTRKEPQVRVNIRAKSELRKSHEFAVGVAPTTARNAYAYASTGVFEHADGSWVGSLMSDSTAELAHIRIHGYPRVRVGSLTVVAPPSLTFDAYVPAEFLRMSPRLNGTHALELSSLEIAEWAMWFLDGGIDGEPLFSDGELTPAGAELLI